MARGEDHLWLKDVFAAFGPVRVKSMFGGQGLYSGEFFIGLVADGAVYLRVDDTNRADYEAEGMKPFTFEFKSGKTGTMSYWEVPARLYDDPHEMAAWARRSLAAARAKAGEKTGAKKRGTRKV
ncbi:MAG TPA: TfoX/Sxy family protein [Micropepsaceae bacterium]|nr:TfoX/Sxy family protein [Micropepsaceae bacterium]